MRLGIRKKIFLGFLIICFILLLSGIAAIFEMNRLQRSVSGILSRKVETVIALHNIEATMVEQVNFLLYSLHDDPSREELAAKTDKINGYMETICNDNLTDNDSLALAGLAHRLIHFEAMLKGHPYLWDNDYAVRRTWYADSLYPVFFDIRQEISLLINKANTDMEATSAEIESGFYRSNIPAVIAIIIGIVLVLLFNYFVNHYFISPLLRISKGARKYLDNRIKYQVEVEHNDELGALNEAVKELIEEHQTTAAKP